MRLKVICQARVNDDENENSEIGSYIEYDV